MCINVFVFPREIRKINKRGEGQNKLRGGGGSKNHEKNKRLPPRLFEPERIDKQSDCLNNMTRNDISVKYIV